jgi:hypothetical protein
MRNTATAIAAIYCCEPTDFPSLLKRILTGYKWSGPLRRVAVCWCIFPVLMKDEAIFYREALGTAVINGVQGGERKLYGAGWKLDRFELFAKYWVSAIYNFPLT